MRTQYFRKQLAPVTDSSFRVPRGSVRESFRCIKSGTNHWKKVYRHQGVTTQVILRGFILDLADSKELVTMLAVS